MKGLEEKRAIYLLELSPPLGEHSDLVVECLYVCGLEERAMTSAATDMDIIRTHYPWMLSPP